MGHLKPGDYLKVLLKEAAAGTIMGSLLGLIILGFSVIWHSISPQVGLVVAISLPVRQWGCAGRGLGGGHSAEWADAWQASWGKPACRGTCRRPTRKPRPCPSNLRPRTQVVSLWANMLGGVFPLLSAKAGLNPAVTSAPLMTTVVDSSGLVIYFYVARVVMGV